MNDQDVAAPVVHANVATTMRMLLVLDAVTLRTVVQPDGTVIVVPDGAITIATRISPFATPVGAVTVVVPLVAVPRSAIDIRCPYRLESRCAPTSVS
ncbi:hypothetical protein [Nocardia pseudovaccinii]|uniref:hypothetical protein n=1 Tax=Nocardia pseudovaccinii TaxID=189540 RepID=UPI0012F47866|nr:hypothetical protein [Nocardia pseudovaccinii]